MEDRVVKSVQNGTESLSFRGPKTWDMLPDDIKKSESLREFVLKGPVIFTCPPRAGADFRVMKFLGAFQRVMKFFGPFYQVNMEYYRAFYRVMKFLGAFQRVMKLLTGF